MRKKHSRMQNQYCTFSYFYLKIKVRKEGNTMEYQTLNNGLKMPIVGFGVFRVPDKKECEESVYQAIKAGYRLIDTAASYTNEDAVGAGVKRAIEEGVCTRKDLFITSKMWVQDMKNYETAKRAIDASIEKSGLGYLDLYLLHQAMGDYFSAWRAMEDAYKEGKLKAIGVSNFYGGVLCSILSINKPVEKMEWEEIRKCAVLGNAVAGLCVQKRGGIPAIPTKEAVLEFMMWYKKS